MERTRARGGVGAASNRNGKFLLIDLSVNGTYVYFNHREYIFVHRDELVLKGSGHISLGMEADPEHPEDIHFERIEDERQSAIGIPTPVFRARAKPFVNRSDRAQQMSSSIRMALSPCRPNQALKPRAKARTALGQAQISATLTLFPSAFP